MPRLLPARVPLLLGALCLGSGCGPEPTPSPTEAAIAAGIADPSDREAAARAEDAETVDRAAQPPLYQLLYEAPTLPGATPEAQQVRLLIWLRHMQLTEPQLAMLAELRTLVGERQAQIVTAEERIVARYAEQEAALYRSLWEALSAGAPADAPEVVALTEQLADLGRGSDRERELLQTRVQGIRAVIEALQPFLSTLSPRQEALLGDATFALRNHLDPVGNPGDFRALVGTTYDPGEYAVLTRGLASWGAAPLNIGGLWADEPPVRGGALMDARREVLVYLLLLEPGMDPAVAAARELLARDLDLGLEPAEDTGAAGEEAPVEGAAVEEDAAEEDAAEEDAAEEDAAEEAALPEERSD